MNIGDKRVSVKMGGGVPRKRSKKAAKKSVAEPKDVVTRSSEETSRITILHTNDIHGRIEAFIDDKKSTKTEVGGLSCLGAVIKKEKKKDPENTLLLDAGDVSTGGAVSDYFKSLPIIDAMNNLGYDAMTVGNHELDVGLKGLRDIVTRADFPVLSANLKEMQEELLGIKPYKIQDVNGVKVGILGLTTPDAPGTSMMSEDEKKCIKFLSAAATAKRMIPKMRKEGAELIIVLSHLGIDDDCDLAEKVNGIDVIVGGHSHTAMKEHININDTIITQAGTAGENLGKIQIDVVRSRGKARIMDVKTKLIPITTKKVKPDRGVRRVLNKYSRQLDSLMNRAIGKTRTSLRQRDFHVYKEESSLGNFATDAVREQSETEICVLSPSALRSNIQSGEITVGDIYELYPFNDKLNVVEIKGKDLKKVLEETLGSTFHSFTISGAKVKMDTKLPEGKRVIEIQMPDGKPIDPNRIFRIGVQSSLLKKDVCKTLNKAKDLGGKGLIRELLIENIEKQQVISAKRDGRIRNIGYE